MFKVAADYEVYALVPHLSPSYIQVSNWLFPQIVTGQTQRLWSSLVVQNVLLRSFMPKSNRKRVFDVEY